MSFPVLFGAAVALAVVPGFADLANTPKMAVAGVGLAIMAGWLRLTLGAWLLLGWGAVTALGLAWTPDPWMGLRELWFLVLFGLAYSVGQSGKAESIMLGLAWGTLVSVGLAALECFWGLALVAEAFPPSGLFSNKNFLGEACALLALWMLLHRRWGLAGSLALGVWVTEYRAGALALALAGLLWLWHWRKDIALGVAALSAIAATVLWSGHSLGLRWIIWEQTLGQLTWLGHGPGSFAQLFPSFNLTYDLMVDRPEHPHNEAINLAFTLGLFVAFPVGLYGYLYSQATRTERYLLVAALAPLGLSFPLELPISLVVLGLVAGSADRNGLPLGDWFAGWRDRECALLATRFGRADSRRAAAS